MWTVPSWPRSFSHSMLALEFARFHNSNILVSVEVHQLSLTWQWERKTPLVVMIYKCPASLDPLPQGRCRPNAQVSV